MARLSDEELRRRRLLKLEGDEKAKEEGVKPGKNEDEIKLETKEEDDEVVLVVD